MQASFHLEVDRKPNKQGLYQVYIRITKNRKLKRVKTSIQLNRLSDWNSKTKIGKYIRTSEPNAKQWNDVLEKELEQAKNTLREDSSASLGEVAHHIKHKDSEKSFLEYAKITIADKFKVGASNAKHYQTFLNKLEEFIASRKRTDITFSDLTPAFLSKFEAFLHTISNERQGGKLLNQNYIKALMVKFRAIINRAIDIDGLMKVEENPFRTYRLIEVKTMKAKLDKSEMNTIAALDLPKGSWLWNTRNAFLFSYYCAGIRIGDFLQLRWGNITDSGRLVYQMGKNHKPKDIPLVKQAKDILNLYWKEGAKPTDYIFSLLDSEADWARYATQEQKDTMPVELKKALQSQIYSKSALMNKCLKTIAKKAGIDKNISFHISRHSFTHRGMKAGINPVIMQRALNHSSLSITERYMGEFNDKEVDDALQKIFAEVDSDNSGNSENSENPNVDSEALLASLKKLDSSTLTTILSQLNTQKA